jgi:flagellar hook-associated protein 3 FlgL
MRVSSAFRYDQLSSYIGSTQRRVQETQDRVTTGKRITTPSDDAAGTRQLLGLSSLRAGIASYTKNLDVAKGALSSTESAYSDIGDLVQQAQTLTIQATTSNVDQGTRNGIAAQIATLQSRLVSIGNSQGPDGRYLFGGQVTDAKPFSVAPDGSLVYGGNSTVPTVETGPGESAKIGETGATISDLYAKLTTLQDSLKTGDLTALSVNRLDELKTASDGMIAARADVGRRMNGIEATRSDHERRDSDFEARATDIGDVDYATAVIDYTAAQTAYQAALQVASKGFSTGLMDFIR